MKAHCCDTEMGCYASDCESEDAECCCWCIRCGNGPETLTEHQRLTGCEWDDVEHVGRSCSMRSSPHKSVDLSNASRGDSNE